MTAQHILSELVRRGVTLQATERGTLRFSPVGAVTPELKEAIKQHKAELLSLLGQPPMTDAIAELLMRYEIGEFEPKVRHRLNKIFRNAPPDAMQRLHRACEYLGVNGSQVDEVGNRALSLEREGNKCAA